MRNPIFKNEVDDLFEKLADWPRDPSRVARTVSRTDGELAREIARGQSIGRAGKEFIDKAPDILRTVARGAGRVLAPASQEVAAPFFGALRGIKDFAVAHPATSRLAVGGALALPILAKSFTDTQQGYGERLMNLREDPSRDVRQVTASLEEFLEKKAGANGIPGFYGMNDTARLIQTGFLGTIGVGLGVPFIKSISSSIGSGIDSLKNLLIGDRQRKQLFDQLIMTDVLLRDQVSSKPESLQFLRDAYATMCRFAPSLSTDTNAVRSFLREVVVGGGGVNYLTIKDLIQTEKALHSKGKD